MMKRFLAILVMAVAASAAQAAQAPPKPEPFGDFPHVVTRTPTKAQLRCYGRTPTPLCAVEAINACRMIRDKVDDCLTLFVPDGGPDEYFGTQDGNVVKIRLRIRRSGHVTADDIAAFGAKALFIAPWRVGDMMVEVDWNPCGIPYVHDDCRISTVGNQRPEVYILRKVGKRWRIVDYYWSDMDNWTRFRGRD